MLKDEFHALKSPVGFLVSVIRFHWTNEIIQTVNVLPCDQNMSSQVKTLRTLEEGRISGLRYESELEVCEDRSMIVHKCCTVLFVAL